MKMFTQKLLMLFLGNVVQVLQNIQEIEILDVLITNVLVFRHVLRMRKLRN